MKKIVKILAILVSMALVCNLQVFSVFGEEILQDPVTEVEADESIMPEEAETENELCAGSYTPEGASYILIYEELDDGTIKITGCDGTKKGELIIPSEIDGKAVTVIGSEAFMSCHGFTGSLTIPDSVTEIGENAFKNCNKFTGNLTISDSVTTIGPGAFYGCSEFTGSLTIPDSVTTIGDSVFRNCSHFMGNLTIPDNVTTIGDSAFKSCSGFTGSLTIPDSVETIGKEAFCNCSGFTGNLTIGDSVTEIGEYAFKGCSGFTGNLTIPDSVETIGKEAFCNCSGFTGNLTIGDSVTEIGEDTFRSCSSFSGSLTIGNSVTMIRNSAFQNCSGFSGNLVIPDSVTYIGWRVFCDCSGFSGSLTIGDSVTEIGESAFYGCSGFTGSLTIPDSVTDIGEGAFYGCSGFTGNLTIGDSVTGIWEGAFKNCSGFTGSLTIPDSVTTIREDAFGDCNGFRKIVNRSNKVYTLPSPDEQTWVNAATGEPITASPATITNGTAIRSDFYKPMDVPFFTHDTVEAQTYTGKAIKPAVKVYFGTTLLEEKKDYTITYRNNTNAGTATFTVIGKGNYAGNDSDSFEILKKNLTDPDVTFTEPAAEKYTKKEQNPVPKITCNGMILKKDKDFTVSCYSDEAYSEWCVPTEPGTYYIRITGIGNFEGEVKTTFVIANLKKKLMNSLKADKIADKLYANGEAIELTDEELVIRDGKTPLTRGVEYEVRDEDYSDNILPGTAKVTIRGIEKNGYVGTMTLTFKIKGTPINKATITAPADVTYNGSEQESEPEVKLNDTPLIKDTDYELIYEKGKNINVGKAKVTIKGKGGYTGSVSKTFTIKPADLKDTSIQLIPADTESGDEYPYVQSGVQPGVTVKLGTLKLKEGRDYTLKYADNTAVTSASTKQPTVTITGKGNYTGKQVKPFVIIPADIDSCTVAVDDVVYKDKNGNWKPKKVTVYGTDGKALKVGKDYDDKTMRYTSDPEGEEEILPNAKLDAGTTVYVWVDAKGTNYTGTVKGTYRIMKQDIGKLSATLDPKAYTGKEVKLSKGDIRWKSGGKITNDVTFDFDENSYKNNVNKGKATVVVKGTGNYGGTKTITFTIGSKGILWWWRNLFN